jgi:EAL domain-containing protein (putative c-di-GMP-specific phosphodiesterase class I)
LQQAQFELDYQPVVDAQSRLVVCCEALIRWRHPERGLVPPGDFIFMAETLGLMSSLGYWVLETACREAQTWPAHVKLAVNLSPVQFNDAALTDHLQEILERGFFRRSHF